MGKSKAQKAADEAKERGAKLAAAAPSGAPSQVAGDASARDVQDASAQNRTDRETAERDK